MVRKIKVNVKISTIGSFFIIVAIVIFTNYHIYNYMHDKIEKKRVEQFLEANMNNQGIIDEEEFVELEEEIKPNQDENKNTDSYDYIGILEIPKIDFQKGFFDVDDKRNNVNQNIQVIKNSTMPDIDKSLLVIAGHSGNGINNYFHYLYKLDYNDEVYIYYKNIKYVYHVVNIYEKNKDGSIDILSSNDSQLVLTTCSQSDKSKQIVIISNLINKIVQKKNGL